MTNQKAVAGNSKRSRVDLGGTALTGLSDVVERSLRGDLAARWAAGFVTADGIHIPLFVSQAAQQLSEGLVVNSNSGRDRMP
jgi:hypothetical protein